MEICLIAAERLRYHGDSSRLGQPLFPPLSLMTIAALTPEKHNVTITDESIEAVDFDQEPDLVGLTAMTAAAPRAYQIADRFRQQGVPVVMGGMHASALPDEALQHVDSVVIGEAEELWPQLLEDFQQGSLQPVYRHEEYPDPATIPAARRDLIDIDKYVAKYTMQASRGCPFACSFCTVSTFFGRTYRTRPIEDVIAEAASLEDEPIILVDDNIMGHPSYAEQLFEALADLKTTFATQASTTMLKTPELITKAAEAGCRALFVGLESISSQQLAKIGKNFNAVEKYKELVQRLHDNGISIIGSFMFGLDGDESDVFERTADFAEEAQIDIGQFSILTPLPGTKLYQQLQREDRIFDEDWSNYDGTRATFVPQGMSREKLDAGLQWIYERFYSWRSIFKRTASRLQPLIWTLNAIYHRRAGKWVTEMRQHLATGE